MLVLTRKLQEAIKIGEDIELTVLSIDGDQVKLGISAPKYIEIHRKEVFLSIQQENNQAASISLNTFQALKKIKNT
ncbi:carbon storage regulator CsrA [Fictibacillus phosphorivorans]|uniref:Translational regulator CsrA n=1 Tax=Fictibacillus phosphorivorans TaxID=1221500 RepID=A0A160IQU8_9BACL|nr:carbon storage regulator CsrA [Fictibacillus phosphorivorans]ANC78597.1 carbon storage regulator [Fictibacillus phosphorivorans]MQR94831.1 carbon storage regulator [Fictibacillus phosphorivorans]